VVLVACVLAGCSGGEDPDPAASGTTGTTTASASGLVGPEETFARFIRASARRDADGVWALMSPGSRRRLGPTLAAFRAGEFRALARETRRLRDGFRVVLAGRITERWGLAAATRGSAAYGSALRLDGLRWSVELAGPISIEAVRPEPGERVRGRTQIAAEVKAGARIEDAGLWLDGRALPARGGGSPDHTALTMFADSGPLAGGRHSAVAFAATRGAARVYAWTFRARATKGEQPQPPPVGPA
jgi:hypothetical protein